MIRDERNLIPATMAVLMHVLVFGSLFVVLDFSSNKVHPAMPLAIKGTLVTDSAVMIPPPVVQEAPPVVETPPDNSEQLQREAEDKKRRADALAEKQRIDQIKQKQDAEKQRVADEAEKKKLADEAEKKRVADLEKKRRDEEADKERKRIEAEKKREADIQRQREENERQRRAETEQLRQSELDAESSRLAAMNSNEMAAYLFALQQAVVRNWARPASAKPGLACIVRIQQLPGGEVVNTTIVSCNGDDAVQRSIIAAVIKASPLPTPSNPILFDRTLVFEFKPES